MPVISTVTTPTKKFNIQHIRSFLWPIHGYEMKKFLPLFCMFALISFSYTMLKSSKDALILTYSSVEALSILKLYGVLPGAFLYMWYYSFLCNKCDKNNVFYYGVAPFIIFFSVFLTILYPYQDYFIFKDLEGYYQGLVSQGFFLRTKSIVQMIQYWPFSFYYIMSELWGSAVLSLLFWGFTNRITSLEQADRFYPLLGLGASLGLVLCGPFTDFLSFLANNQCDVVIFGLMITFLICATSLLLIYRWMLLHILPNPLLVPPEISVNKKNRKKPSFYDAMTILMSSRHLLLIATMVVCYNLSMNLFEAVWKNQVRVFYSIHGSNNTLAMAQFFAHTYCWTGVLSIVLMLFVSGQAERRYGWRFVALMTPGMMLVIGGIFFAVASLKQFSGAAFGLFSLGDPLFITLIIGSIQNGISKSSKYSLFDPTKEKAYFPLSEQEQTEGKGAIDVIVSRFGKAGGALIQQLLMITFGSLTYVVPLLAGIILVIIIVWIWATIELADHLEVLKNSQKLEVIEEIDLDKKEFQV